MFSGSSLIGVMLPAFLAFVISAVAGHFVIPILRSLKAEQTEREEGPASHKKKSGTPNMGGVIFIGAFLIICIIWAFRNPEVIPVAILTVGFGAVGFIDDFIKVQKKRNLGLRAWQKIVLQLLIAISYAAYIINVHGTSLSMKVPFAAGKYVDFGAMNIPFLLFVALAVVNATNLTDGIDGLASGLSMVALSVFGTLAVIDDRWMSALLAFTTVGVLLPFFFYNVFGNADRGRKIFMGDTGSLTLGYILSFLAVQYTMNTYEAGINYEGAILISFSVLLVPCLDVVRVVLGRVRRGKDPFMPDKTHIHHKFLAMGFTPRKAMISILCISFLFCASNVFLVSYLNNTVLFLCDVAVWTLMNLYISKLISRRNISQI